MSYQPPRVRPKRSSAQIAEESALSRRLMMSMEPGSSRWRRVRDQIVEDNIGLTHAVSRRLAGAFGFHSFEDRQDATSEVQYALVLLVERWDPDRMPLAPALFFAARERLRAAQESGSGFGGAVLQVRNAKRVRREVAALEQRLNRVPSDLEVVESLNARVMSTQMHPERSGALLTVEVVQTLRARLMPPEVIDASSDHDDALEDLLAPVSVVAECESSMFISEVASMIAEVDADMARVFRCRFGLDDGMVGEVVPYAEVAERTGVELGAVKALLLRARKVVGEWLEAEADASMRAA